MNADFALIRHGRPDAIFAYRKRRPISVARFLGDVAALAALLPPHRHVLNLCADRYRFTVALAAALCRKQISLLPPSDTPGVLSALAGDFSDLYCLTDGTPPEAGIPSLIFPDDLGDAPAPPAVPVFPGAQHAVLLFTGTVPHQHSYGLESTVLLALQHGLALLAERPLYPADIAACLEAVPRPRLLVTTPIHIRTLLDETWELPAADLLVSATAPLSEPLAAAAEARFGAPLLEIYGCTEAGQIAVRPTAQSAEWRCLDGVVLRQDERGTWASGAPVESETLLHDVIELRDRDRFLLHGRTADLVNIAGKRSSLTDLNHHLTSIEGVRDGIFVMPEEPDERVARLMAFVVAPGLAPQTILRALRQRIDAAFLPRPYCLIRRIHLSHGADDRRTLRIKQ